MSGQSWQGCKERALGRAPDLNQKSVAEVSLGFSVLEVSGRTLLGHARGQDQTRQFEAGLVRWCCNGRPEAPKTVSQGAQTSRDCLDENRQPP